MSWQLKYDHKCFDTLSPTGQTWVSFLMSLGGPGEEQDLVLPCDIKAESEVVT
jgi:hypothetical protein